MFVPFKIKASAVAVAVALAGASLASRAALERVGPVSNAPEIGGFPLWYQDTTGITLDFCAPINQSEADGGWCLLLPTDVTVPELFPGNFFDEHFYFAATTQIGTRQAGQKAILVMAEESAFANGAVVPGDQMTFSRIRVVLNPVPATGKYRFIHPYGEEVIDGVVGDRIFFTDDVGITCAQGQFDCSLRSRLGPFLLPSDVPGGPEMPPLTLANPAPDQNDAHFGGAFAPTIYPGTGKAYIADPARSGPVTGGLVQDYVPFTQRPDLVGSDLVQNDGTPRSRNHNVFRIEGPAGAALGSDPSTGAPLDWIETNDFNLMGRLHDGAIPGKLTVERASYSREPANASAVPPVAARAKVDVLAQGEPSLNSRLPTQNASVAEYPALTFFDAPCAGTVDPVSGAIKPPFSAPVGASETQMLSMGSQYWAQKAIGVNAVPSSVCVKFGNARDGAGNVVPTFSMQRVSDEVSISEANYDSVLKTLTVKATSSDTVAPPTLRLAYQTFGGADLTSGAIVVTGVEVPPPAVRVTSNANGGADGFNTRPVKTGVAPAAVPPIAPSNVAAALVPPVLPVVPAARSLTVTWNDNSTDETNFQILRATTAAGTYTQIAVVGPNMSSFVDNNGGLGLAANTSYFYRVVALRGTVASAIAQSAGLTTPAAPTSANLLTTTVIQGTPLSVAVGWNDRATNETTYQVFRRTGVGAYSQLGADLPAGSTSFTDATVVAGTTYTYRVDVSNWAQTVSTTSAAVIPVVVTLAAPTNLTATVSTTPRLNWVDNSTGETNYRASRTPVTVNANGSVTLGATTTISSTIAANATTFLEPNGQGNNVTRRYDVAALSGATVGPVASVYTVTTALPQGNTPTLLRSLAGTAPNQTARVTVNWAASGTATVGGYEIQRCTVTTGGGCTPFVKLDGTAVNTTGTVDGRGTTSFLDTSVARGTTYRYRLRTVGGTGTGVVGTFSGTATVTTQ